MAINKVNYGNTTLIDLTEDTVVENSLLSGYTAHSADGNIIQGSLVLQSFRTGTSEPDSSLGDNGDLFLIVEG